MGTMHNRSCRSRNIQRNSSLRSNYKFLREHWCILNNLDLRDKVRNKGHEELILVYVYHLRGPEGGVLGTLERTQLSWTLFTSYVGVYIRASIGKMRKN